MPDWKPIVAAPFATCLMWAFAYSVAGTREPHSIESNFSWLMLLPFIVGFWWLVVVVAIVLLRAIVLRFVSQWGWAIAVVATLANVAGVAVLYGETLSHVGGDAWPADALSIGSAVFAAGVSLLPIAWIWRGHSNDRVTTPVSDPALSGI